MEKQTDFRIRSYGRTELAQLYNPCLTPRPPTGNWSGGSTIIQPRRPPCRAWQAARFAFLHPCPGAGDRRGARRTVTHKL
ncbi:MAG: hypothetical protein ACLRS8_16150 [Parabacteroides merdae]